MKLIEYLKDKFVTILLFFFTYFIILSLFVAFKVDFSLIVVISFLLFLFLISGLLIDYFRRYFFYQELLNHIEVMDKSYLVLETLKKPSFYEGELLYQVLYDINKSMNENVKKYEEQMNEFKEYIEMWIHEVKIPLSSLNLLVHNHGESADKRVAKQLRRIDDYVDQVLYYVRSENAEKDYFIKENQLDKIISNVALKNKDDLLERKIDFIVENVSFSVDTDSKWLEFILNQIINNSIKYRREGIEAYIKISAELYKNKIVLVIEDNGVGIPSFDIPRVFDKSFTGYNGRKSAKSTGMGLHISKNLCEKLGHKIEVESIQHQYTKVLITFYKNEYYEVLK